MALLDEETGHGPCTACEGCGGGKGGEPVFRDSLRQGLGQRIYLVCREWRGVVWYFKSIVRGVDYGGSLPGGWWFRENRSFLRAVAVMEVEDLECVRRESLDGVVSTEHWPKFQFYYTCRRLRLSTGKISANKALRGLYIDPLLGGIARE